MKLFFLIKEIGNFIKCQRTSFSITHIATVVGQSHNFANFDNCAYNTTLEATTTTPSRRSTNEFAKWQPPRVLFFWLTIGRECAFHSHFFCYVIVGSPNFESLTSELFEGAYYSPSALLFTRSKQQTSF